MFHRASVADRRRALAAVVLTGAMSTGALAALVGGDLRTDKQPATAPADVPVPLVVTLSLSHAGDLAARDAPSPRVAFPAPQPGEVERWLAWQGEAPLQASVDLRVKPPVHELQVSAGDTLLGMLTDVGVDRAEAHAAVAGLADVYDPRDLRPGRPFRF